MAALRLNLNMYLLHLGQSRQLLFKVFQFIFSLRKIAIFRENAYKILE